MKQYVIDELRPEDYRKLKDYLDKNFKESELSGIYWIPLENDYLTEIQIEHTQCQPFYFTVELDSNTMACELLVRTQNRMRCACMGYANIEQRNLVINFIDGMCDNLKIIT